MNVVELNVDIPSFIIIITRPVLTETLSAEEDSITQGPGDLIVSNENVDASSGKDGAGVPGSGDARSIKIVVGDVDILTLAITQVQETMIT